MSTGGERKGKLWEERVVLRVKKTWFIVEFRGNTRGSLKHSPMGNKLDVSYSHKIRTFLFIRTSTYSLACEVYSSTAAHSRRKHFNINAYDGQETNRQTNRT